MRSMNRKQEQSRLGLIVSFFKTWIWWSCVMTTNPFSDPHIFATWWGKPLIFQTSTTCPNITHILKYQRFTTWGCNDIGIRKLVFTIIAKLLSACKTCIYIRMRFNNHATNWNFKRSYYKIILSHFQSLLTYSGVQQTCNLDDDFRRSSLNKFFLFPIILDRNIKILRTSLWKYFWLKGVRVSIQQGV